MNGTNGDDSSDRVRWRPVSEILKAEFEHIHDEPLPGDIQRRFDCGNEAERLAALYSAVHRRAESAAEVEGGGVHPGQSTALCLSGGGIRSATFGLGVLQGLARLGWLRRFDYLSTVSGGGYIGSWLSRWINEDGLDNVCKGLESAKDAGDALNPEPEPIRWLRSYSNYMSPKRGLSIDFLTLAATFLRNLLLHWLVLLPLIVAALLLPRLNLSALNPVLLPTSSWLLGLGAFLSFFLGAAAVAYIDADLPGIEGRRPTQDNFVAQCLVPLVLASVLLSWTWAWWLAHAAPAPTDAWTIWIACVAGGIALHSVGIVWGETRRGGQQNLTASGVAWDMLGIILSGTVGGSILTLGATQVFGSAKLITNAHLDPRALGVYATLAVPFLLASFFLATAVYVGLSTRSTSEDDREWWARSGAWLLVVSAGWILANVLVIHAPAMLEERLPLLLSGGGTVGALVTAIGYFSNKAPGMLAGRAPGFAALGGRTVLNVAALAFIAALLIVLSFGTSAVLKLLPGMSATTYGEVLHATSGVTITAAILVLFAFALFVSGCTGVNTYSLHALYGNRLVRGYLGALNRHRNPHRFTGFDRGDNVDMSALIREKPRAPYDGFEGPLPQSRLQHPFHILNLTLNLVAGNRLEWQQRKAESFTVSPLHVGSRWANYQPSETYAGGMTLGRAATISGAAASPNMGYHSSPLVTFVMAFFNVRLGWWLPNPGLMKWREKEPTVGLGSTVQEMLGQTTDRSDWIYVSDGGHFDNLGLYEMVLRRNAVIVVVDASCDPKFEFTDLENAVQKIRTDLGIPIDFPHGLPQPRKGSAPSGHFTIGRIRYSAADPGGVDGWLIYVKPMLCAEAPLDVCRYAATNSDPKSPFPHQSTNDQFFDERQFESYRELGLHSIMHAFPKPEEWPWAGWKGSWTRDDMAEGNGRKPFDGQHPDLVELLRELLPASGAAGSMAAGSMAAGTVAAATAAQSLVPWALPGALALAAIPLASWTISVATSAPQPPTAVMVSSRRAAVTAPSPVIVVAPNSSGDVDTIMLPFFSNEARQCGGDPRRCSYGLDIDESAKPLLHALTQALVRCARKDGSKIRVALRGFASSSEFKGTLDGNKTVGEIRAKQVRKIMMQEKEYDKNRLQIRTPRWSSSREMMRARRYLDGEGKDFDVLRGALTRRVDIVLRDIGSCAPSTIVKHLLQQEAVPAPTVQVTRRTDGDGTRADP